jgi:hypothetical protein
MNELSLRSLFTSRVALIAGLLVVSGVVLYVLVSKPFLVLIGLGAFGPGIFRELGWLRDQDEFQVQTTRRAGYHAYLTGGLVTVLVLSLMEVRGPLTGDASEWILLVLVVLWMTWLFSSVMAFWGAPRTAARVLSTFGLFWAVFVFTDLISSADIGGDPMGFVLRIAAGCAAVAPFFVPAFTAARWPRATGAGLLVVALALAVLLASGGNLPLATQLLTMTLLLVPFAGSGIALLKTDHPHPGRG